ncbi:MAG: glycosyl hydrolase family 18 [Clostridiales bacterium]|nr:glycosyl hydrolase family 18 [Clostridiales bacterium]
MSRKAKQIIILVVFIVTVIATIVAISLIKKFKPSDQVMDINEYYQVENNEALVILQNGIYDKMALYEDGAVYLDYETVVSLINKRFYWDNNENLLIYTTPTELIKASIGSKDYSVNKNNESLNHPISKTKDGMLYIAIDFVDKYSDMQYQFYESPNRLLIQNDWGDYLFTSVKKDTQLRVLDDIKSDILLELKEGTKLKFVNNEVIYDNGFSKVMTDDGIIGFVRNKYLTESFYERIESTFVEPEYVQTKKNTPINLVWHQVTNQSANNNLLSDLEGTKGVTTISPTWYSIISNDGSISSLASEAYVERAHSQGLEVWGLVDDFNPEIDIVRVLSYTSSREKLINELISSAIKYNLDGINIDFERIPQSGGIHFIQFIRELSIRCRSNGLVLSIDNYVPREYSAYYDLEEQGIVADYVIIMAYDEHHSTSEVSGSVASIGFVKDAIERTLTMVPKEKTIIGIPFYSRLWKEDHSGIVETQALAMTNAQKTFEVNGVEAEWDSTTGQYYGEYEKDGYIYKMWLEEEESIDLKMQAISKADVAGVAAWKLGLERSEVWNVINKYLN